MTTTRGTTTDDLDALRALIAQACTEAEEAAYTPPTLSEAS